MKFLILIFAVSLFQNSARSNDLNLNEICQGILFKAIAHPYDRNLFIGCVQGRGTIFGCENVYDIFDPESISCVDPNSLTTGESTTEETTQKTTTTPTTTTTLPPTTTTTTTLPPTTTSSSLITTTPGNGISISFVCPVDGSHAYIPSSTVCTRYFECILGVAHLRDCPTVNNVKLHFDVFTRTCMDPADAFCANLIQCG